MLRPSRARKIGYSPWISARLLLECFAVSLFGSGVMLTWLLALDKPSERQRYGCCTA